VTPDSDERLMADAMRGDTKALVILADRYYEPILAYLYRLAGGQRQVAEDLAQETFLRLMQQESYRPDRAFRPWLYAIATNLARDHFRSRVRHPLVSEDAAAMLDLVDSTPGPEVLAEAAEAGQAVAHAFDRIGAEYRAALLLRYYHGLSLNEIADALGIPLGTVKSRLSVGTRHLRELLQPIHEGANS
jgi:RNA polymerase sigma-70 factor, ECF subfamily